MKQWLLLFLLLSYCSFIFAQAPYAWRITDEQGLANMVIYNLFQDSKGYMWISTSSGLLRYNGAEFKSFRHSQQQGSSVSSVREDSKGNIWYKNFSKQLFWIDSLKQVQQFSFPDSIDPGPYFNFFFSPEHLHIEVNHNSGYTFECSKWLINVPQQIPQQYPIYKYSLYQEVKTWTTEYCDKFWETTPEFHKTKHTTTTPNVFTVYPLSANEILLYNRNQVFVGPLSQIFTLSPELSLLQFEQYGLLKIFWIQEHIWVMTSRGAYCFEKTTSKKWKH